MLTTLLLASVQFTNSYPSFGVAVNVREVFASTFVPDVTAAPEAFAMDTEPPSPAVAETVYFLTERVMLIELIVLPLSPELK